MRSWTALPPIAEAGVADARRLQQRLAHVADQRRQPLVDVVGLVDLVEEIGAALQVEAEHDLLLGQEAGPAGERVLREEIRDDRQEAGEHRTRRMTTICQRGK